MWTRWVGAGAEQATLAYGGYYTTLVQPGWRVIALNSLYMDSNNLLDGGVDPAGQWAWVRAQLAGARTAGEVRAARVGGRGCAGGSTCHILRAARVGTWPHLPR